MKKIVTLLLAALLLLPATRVAAVPAPAEEIARAEQVIADAKAMAFPTTDTNVELPCPVCGKTVEWLAWSLDSAANLAASNSHNLIDKHIFLIGDMTGIEDIYDKTINYDGFVFTASKKNTHTVIHLNGHIIKGPQGGIRVRGGDLNIIGDGEVWGNRNNSKYGSNLNADEVGTLNIYGGTYYKTSPQPLLRIIDDGNVNLYGGKIEGNDAKAGGTVRVTSGAFRIYGGLVEVGYTSKEGDSILVEADGAVAIFGGKVAGGKDETGGNIYTSGSLTISGGEISGAIKEFDGSLTITGGYLNSVVLGENVTITGGQFTTDITRLVAEGIRVSEKNGVYGVGESASALPATGDTPWLWIALGGVGLFVVLTTVIVLIAKKNKEE